MIGLLDWVGPVFLIFMLVGIFLFRSYRVTQADRKRRKQAVKASAIPASAKVLRVGDSDFSSGGIDVELTFEVTPPNGVPYQVTNNWSVEPLSISKVQPGSVLAVKIDAKNPKIIYSAEDWAWGNGQMPTN